MTTQAVEALQLIHEQVQDLLPRISADDWSKPSGCAGWRVQDVLAHMSSNMKEIVDPSPPPPESAPDMGAEAAMEALVSPRRDWTVAALTAEYDASVDGWLAAMSAMQEEPTASTVAPLADLGEYPLHMVANAFAFDHYCHLYIDVLAPDGPLALDVAEPSHDMVRPGIEWMLAGVPRMQPTEMAALITEPLELRLTGPGGGTWMLLPAREDGLIEVSEASEQGDERGDAAATITSSSHDFVSWGTKRADWRSTCSIEGNAAYAESFLDTIDII